MSTAFFRIRPFQKLTAFITVVTFVWTQVAMGASLPFSDGVMPVEIKAGFEPAPILEIPSDLAIIKETYGTFSPDEPAFIYIADAHANYDAQVKIKEILKWLHEKEGFDLALLEGATSRFNSDRFRFFPREEYNLDLADTLAKKGLVTGAELFLLEADKNYKAFGIESHDLYVENLKAFRRVLDRKRESEKYLAHVTGQLIQLENHLLNPDLKDLLRARRAYNEETQNIFSYFKTLAREADRHLNLDLTDPYSQIDWPQLMRLALMEKAEKELDQKKIGEETGAFIQKLKELQVKSDLVQSVDALLSGDGTPRRPGILPGNPGRDAPATRSGARNDDIRLLFEHIYAEAGPEGLSFEDFPALTRRIGLLIFRDELIFEELEEEMTRLTDTLSEALAENETERTVLRLAKDIFLLKEAYTLELTKKTLDEFRSRFDEIKPSVLLKRIEECTAVIARSAVGATTRRPGILPGNPERDAPATRLRDRNEELEQILHEVENFYVGAEARDEVFIKKAFDELNANNRKRAVLITGGFHTTSITSALKGKKASFIVVTPKITNIDKDRSLYYEVMTDRTPTRFNRSQIVSPELGAESWEFVFTDAGRDPQIMTEVTLGTTLDLAEQNQWDITAVKDFDPEDTFVNKGAGFRFAGRDSTGAPKGLLVDTGERRFVATLKLVTTTTTQVTKSTELRLTGETVARDQAPVTRGERSSLWGRATDLAPVIAKPPEAAEAISVTSSESLSPAGFGARETSDRTGVILSVAKDLEDSSRPAAAAQNDMLTTAGFGAVSYAAAAEDIIPSRESSLRKLILGGLVRSFDGRNATFVVSNPVFMVGNLAGEWWKRRFNGGNISLDLGEVRPHGGEGQLQDGNIVLNLVQVFFDSYQTIINALKFILNPLQSFAERAELAAEVFKNNGPLTVLGILWSWFGSLGHGWMLSDAGDRVNSFLSQIKLFNKQYAEAPAYPRPQPTGFGAEKKVASSQGQGARHDLRPATVIDSRTTIHEPQSPAGFGASGDRPAPPPKRSEGGGASNQWPSGGVLTLKDLVDVRSSPDIEAKSLEMVLERVAGLSGVEVEYYEPYGAKHKTFDRGLVIRAGDGLPAESILRDILSQKGKLPLDIQSAYVTLAAVKMPEPAKFILHSGESGISTPIGYVASADGTRVVVETSGDAWEVWNVDSNGAHFLYKRDRAIFLYFSPDGTRIFSINHDDTVEITDADTGKSTGTLQDLKGKLTSRIAFSPDGTKLAASDLGGHLKVWDASTGAIIRTFRDKMQMVGSIVFSPDGTKVTGIDLNDYKLKVWDVNTGRLIHTSEINRVFTLFTYLSSVLAPDGTKIFGPNFTSNQTEVEVLDIETGKSVAALGPLRATMSVFSPDGKRVVTVSDDGLALIRDASTGKITRSIKGPRGEVASVSFRAQGAVGIEAIVAAKDSEKANRFTIWSFTLSPESGAQASAGFGASGDRSAPPPKWSEGGGAVEYVDSVEEVKRRAEEIGFKDVKVELGDFRLIGLDRLESSGVDVLVYRHLDTKAAEPGREFDRGAAGLKSYLFRELGGGTRYAIGASEDYKDRVPHIRVREAAGFGAGRGDRGARAGFGAQGSGSMEDLLDEFINLHSAEGDEARAYFLIENRLRLEELSKALEQEIAITNADIPPNPPRDHASVRKMDLLEQARDHLDEFIEVNGRSLLFWFAKFIAQEILPRTGDGARVGYFRPNVAGNVAVQIQGTDDNSLNQKLEELKKQAELYGIRAGTSRPDTFEGSYLTLEMDLPVVSIIEALKIGGYEGVNFLLADLRTIVEEAIENYPANGEEASLGYQQHLGNYVSQLAEVWFMERPWLEYVLPHLLKHPTEPDQQYFRNLVLEVPGKFAIFIHAFRPGGFTPVHDHDGKVGIVVPLTAGFRDQRFALTERVTSYQELDGQEVELTLGAEVYAPQFMGGSVDRESIHQVRNGSRFREGLLFELYIPKKPETFVIFKPQKEKPGKYLAEVHATAQQIQELAFLGPEYDYESGAMATAEQIVASPERHREIPRAGEESTELATEFSRIGDQILSVYEKNPGRYRTALEAFKSEIQTHKVREHGIKISRVKAPGFIQYGISIRSYLAGELGGRIKTESLADLAGTASFEGIHEQTSGLGSAELTGSILEHSSVQAEIVGELFKKASLTEEQIKFLNTYAANGIFQRVAARAGIEWPPYAQSAGFGSEDKVAEHRIPTKAEQETTRFQTSQQRIIAALNQEFDTKAGYYREGLRDFAKYQEGENLTSSRLGRFGISIHRTGSSQASRYNTWILHYFHATWTGSYLGLTLGRGIWIESRIVELVGNALDRGGLAGEEAHLREYRADEIFQALFKHAGVNWPFELIEPPSASGESHPPEATGFGAARLEKNLIGFDHPEKDDLRQQIELWYKQTTDAPVDMNNRPKRFERIKILAEIALAASVLGDKTTFEQTLKDVLRITKLEQVPPSHWQSEIGFWESIGHGSLLFPLGQILVAAQALESRETVKDLAGVIAPGVDRYTHGLHASFLSGQGHIEDIVSHPFYTLTQGYLTWFLTTEYTEGTYLQWDPSQHEPSIQIHDYALRGLVGALPASTDEERRIRLWGWVLRLVETANFFNKRQNTETFRYILNEAGIPGPFTNSEFDSAKKLKIKEVLEKLPADNVGRRAWMISLVRLAAATIGDTSVYNALEVPYQTAVSETTSDADRILARVYDVLASRRFLTKPYLSAVKPASSGEAQKPAGFGLERESSKGQEAGRDLPPATDINSQTTIHDSAAEPAGFGAQAEDPPLWLDTVRLLERYLNGLEPNAAGIGRKDLRRADYLTQLSKVMRQAKQPDESELRQLMLHVPNWDSMMSEVIRRSPLSEVWVDVLLPVGLPPEGRLGAGQYLVVSQPRLDGALFFYKAIAPAKIEDGIIIDDGKRMPFQLEFIYVAGFTGGFVKVGEASRGSKTNLRLSSANTDSALIARAIKMVERYARRESPGFDYPDKSLHTLKFFMDDLHDFWNADGTSKAGPDMKTGFGAATVRGPERLAEIAAKSGFKNVKPELMIDGEKYIASEMGVQESGLKLMRVMYRHELIPEGTPFPIGASKSTPWLVRAKAKRGSALSGRTHKITSELQGNSVYGLPSYRATHRVEEPLRIVKSSGALAKIAKQSKLNFRNAKAAIDVSGKTYRLAEMGRLRNRDLALIYRPSDVPEGAAFEEAQAVSTETPWGFQSQWAAKLTLLPGHVTAKSLGYHIIYRVDAGRAGFGIERGKVARGKGQGGKFDLRPASVIDSRTTIHYSHSASAGIGAGTENPLSEVLRSVLRGERTGPGNLSDKARGVLASYYLKGIRLKTIAQHYGKSYRAALSQYEFGVKAIQDWLASLYGIERSRAKEILEHLIWNDFMAWFKNPKPEQKSLGIAFDFTMGHRNRGLVTLFENLHVPAPDNLSGTGVFRYDPEIGTLFEIKSRTGKLLHRYLIAHPGGLLLKPPPQELEGEISAHDRGANTALYRLISGYGPEDLLFALKPRNVSRRTQPNGTVTTTVNISVPGEETPTEVAVPTKYRGEQLIPAYSRTPTEAGKKVIEYYSKGGKEHIMTVTIGTLNGRTVVQTDWEGRFGDWNSRGGRSKTWYDLRAYLSGKRFAPPQMGLLRVRRNARTGKKEIRIGQVRKDIPEAYESSTVQLKLFASSADQGRKLLGIWASGADVKKDVPLFTLEMQENGWKEVQVSEVKFSSGFGTGGTSLTRLLQGELMRSFDGRNANFMVANPVLMVGDFAGEWLKRQFDVGNVFFQDDNISLQGGNVSTQNRNVFFQDDNIALQGGNVYSQNRNIFFQDDNIALQGGNVSTQNRNIFFQDGDISLQGGNVSTQNRNVFFQDGDIALQGGDVSTQNRNVFFQDDNFSLQGGNVYSQNRNVFFQNDNISTDLREGHFQDDNITFDARQTVIQTVQFFEFLLNVLQSFAERAKLAAEVFKNNGPLTVLGILWSWFGSLGHGWMLSDAGERVNSFLSQIKLFNTQYAEAPAYTRPQAAGFGTGDERTEEVGPPKKSSVDSVEQRKSVLDTPIYELELSVRSRRAVQKLGIQTLRQLTERTKRELLALDNFGVVSLQEIQRELARRGLWLRDTTRVWHLNIPFALKRAIFDSLHIETVSELLGTSEAELLRFKGVGPASIRKLREALPAGFPLPKFDGDILPEFRRFRSGFGAEGEKVASSRGPVARDKGRETWSRAARLDLSVTTAIDSRTTIHDSRSAPAGFGAEKAVKRLEDEKNLLARALELAAATTQDETQVSGFGSEGLAGKFPSAAAKLLATVRQMDFSTPDRNGREIRILSAQIAALDQAFRGILGESDIAKARSILSRLKSTLERKSASLDSKIGARSRALEELKRLLGTSPSGFGARSAAQDEAEEVSADTSVAGRLGGQRAVRGRPPSQHPLEIKRQADVKKTPHGAPLKTSGTKSKSGFGAKSPDPDAPLVQFINQYVLNPALADSDIESILIRHSDGSLFIHYQNDQSEEISTEQFGSSKAAAISLFTRFKIMSGIDVKARATRDNDLKGMVKIANVLFEITVAHDTSKTSEAGESILLFVAERPEPFDSSEGGLMDQTGFGVDRAAEFFHQIKDILSMLQIRNYLEDADVEILPAVRRLAQAEASRAGESIARIQRAGGAGGVAEGDFYQAIVERMKMIVKVTDELLSGEEMAAGFGAARDEVTRLKVLAPGESLTYHESGSPLVLTVGRTKTFARTYRFAFLPLDLTTEPIYGAVQVSEMGREGRFFPIGQLNGIGSGQTKWETHNQPAMNRLLKYVGLGAEFSGEHGISLEITDKSSLFPGRLKISKHILAEHVSVREYVNGIPALASHPSLKKFMDFVYLLKYEDALKVLEEMNSSIKSEDVESFEKSESLAIRLELLAGTLDHHDAAKALLKLVENVDSTPRIGAILDVHSEWVLRALHRSLGIAYHDIRGVNTRTQHLVEVADVIDKILRSRQSRGFGARSLAQNEMDEASADTRLPGRLGGRAVRGKLPSQHPLEIKWQTEVKKTPRRAPLKTSDTKSKSGFGARIENAKTFLQVLDDLRHMSEAGKERLARQDYDVIELDFGALGEPQRHVSRFFVNRSYNDLPLDQQRFLNLAEHFFRLIGVEVPRKEIESNFGRLKLRADINRRVDIRTQERGEDESGEMKLVITVLNETVSAPTKPTASVAIVAEQYDVTNDVMEVVAKEAGKPVNQVSEIATYQELGLGSTQTYQIGQRLVERLNEILLKKWKTVSRYDLLLGFPFGSDKASGTVMWHRSVQDTIKWAQKRFDNELRAIANYKAMHPRGFGAEKKVASSKGQEAGADLLPATTIDSRTTIHDSRPAAEFGTTSMLSLRGREAPEAISDRRLLRPRLEQRLAMTDAGLIRLTLPTIGELDVQPRVALAFLEHFGGNDNETAARAGIGVMVRVAEYTVPVTFASDLRRETIETIQPRQVITEGMLSQAETMLTALEKVFDAENGASLVISSRWIRSEDDAKGLVRTVSAGDRVALTDQDKVEGSTSLISGIFRENANIMPLYTRVLDAKALHSRFAKISPGRNTIGGVLGSAIEVKKGTRFEDAVVIKLKDDRPLIVEGKDVTARVHLNLFRKVRLLSRIGDLKGVATRRQIMDEIGLKNMGPSGVFEIENYQAAFLLLDHLFHSMTAQALIEQAA